MKLFKTLNTKELVLVPESPVSVSHAMIYVTLKREAPGPNLVLEVKRMVQLILPSAVRLLRPKPAQTVNRPVPPS